MLSYCTDGGIVSWRQIIEFSLWQYLQSRETQQSVLCGTYKTFITVYKHISTVSGHANMFFTQSSLYIQCESKKNLRALHGTLFLFGTEGYGFQEPRVQMIRGYGFHIIAVENGRFRRNSVCCGSVYGSCLSLRLGCGPVYDSGLSLLFDFGPVCIQQHISSRTAKSPMTSTLGMHSPLRTNFSIFRHPPSPQQPP